MTAPSPGARMGTAIAIALVAASVAGRTAHADPSLSISTPYPSVEIQPGATVDVDLTIKSSNPEAADIDISGLEAGWGATLRGGGFVIHQITAQPDVGSKATLDIDVPPTATPGEHHVSILAHDATGDRSALDLVLVVAEQVDDGISLSADFPSLSGEPGGTFSYTLTVDNQTPIEQTFTFDPTAPQGWTVTASPSAEAQAQTVTIGAGDTSKLSVTATSPEDADEGSYPIDVAVLGANGARGNVALEADVVGTPKLELGTADQRLDVSGVANREQRIPLIVTNSGSAPMDAVKLAGTAPTDWDVAFDPQQVESVQPGESAQVTAIVTPSADAVAGDYAMTVRASADNLSSNIDLRYTVDGSRTLGVIAIGVIAVAFLALAGVFVKFGRR